MSSPTDPRTITVTPALLREWGLPSPAEGSKYGRGQVLVVGGARQTPGAVLLAGLSALRVGAGRLTMAVAESVAPAMAVAVPEAGVLGLPETDSGSVVGAPSATRLRSSIASADAVLIGPGLDEPEETAALLKGVVPLLGEETLLALDAFALGVLSHVEDAVGDVRSRLVLTPNEEEAARLLGNSDGDLGDLAAAVPRIAERYGAVVSCKGHIAAPDGTRWRIWTGHSGLATSGSGDVLSGAIVGLLARRATPSQAACWATHVHAAAGDRLAARIGSLGFLARELIDQLPAVITELEA